MIAGAAIATLPHTVHNFDAAAEASITAWVSSSETKGLAILALNQLDTMPLEVALNVARAALAGPEADTARSRIERSAVAEIKALVE